MRPAGSLLGLGTPVEENVAVHTVHTCLLLAMNLLGLHHTDQPCDILLPTQNIGRSYEIARRLAKPGKGGAM